ncbi:MAG: hypothetical protein NZ949_07980, partial [Candidatus Kapabacteria bacterium]|nr:hypothetical protein [Candidatus Kapabacteria bacterium]MDW7997553.1 hypothetical protein [Bacteroidota bacterium]
MLLALVDCTDTTLVSSSLMPIFGFSISPSQQQRAATYSIFVSAYEPNSWGWGVITALGRLPAYWV